VSSGEVVFRRRRLSFFAPCKKCRSRAVNYPTSLALSR
jgi:hypothetical protein